MAAVMPSMCGKDSSAESKGDNRGQEAEGFCFGFCQKRSTHVLCKAGEVANA
jgi:hypothetical protein